MQRHLTPDPRKTPVFPGVPAGVEDPLDQPIPETDRLWLRKLVGRAFLLRAGLATVLAVTGLSSRFAPDEYTYANTGAVTALYWSGEVFAEPARLSTAQPLAYFYFNAISFYVFGSAFPLKILNAYVGASACGYLFLLAHSLFGSVVARRAAMLCAYLPSLILWAALNIRDVWVVWLLVFVSLQSVRLMRRYSHRAMLLLILSLAAVSTFRQYLFFVVALPPVVALLIGRRSQIGRNFLLASLSSIGILLLVQQGAAADAIEIASFETLAQTRTGLLYGAGSAYGAGADISTPARALAFLPVGLAYFLFSPFPWDIDTPLKLASMPEMLFLYWLAPSIYLGFRWAVRHRFRAALQTLLLIALLTVSYSLGSGNVGTLFRHRAQALPFFLMLGAVGWETRWLKRTAREQPLRRHG